VYAVDGELLDNYLNRPSIGTEGIDARIQIEGRKLNLLAGVGAYRILAGSDLPEAQVDGPGVTALQGLPATKALLAIGYEAAPWLKLHARGRWQSSMWSLQETGDGPELMNWPSQTELNAGMSLRPGKERRLAIELACDNVLDTPLVLVNPQSNALMPFQRNGRNWTMGVTYKFVR
jgi:outer membrane receptor protein involved in Fe transport